MESLDPQAASRIALDVSFGDRKTEQQPKRPTGEMAHGRPLDCAWFPKGAGGRGAVLTPSWDRDPPFGGTEITK